MPLIYWKHNGSHGLSPCPYVLVGPRKILFVGLEREAEPFLRANPDHWVVLLTVGALVPVEKGERFPASCGQFAYPWLWKTCRLG